MVNISPRPRTLGSPFAYACVMQNIAGTAILSKISPISSTFLIPDHPNPADVKGRIVTLEYQSLYVVGTYVPNAGDKLKVFVSALLSS